MGAKWFTTNISCSNNKNISRLAEGSSSARKGSMLMITGELEIMENQVYCKYTISNSSHNLNLDCKQMERKEIRLYGSKITKRKLMSPHHLIGLLIIMPKNQNPLKKYMYQKQIFSNKIVLLLMIVKTSTVCILNTICLIQITF